MSKKDFATNITNRFLDLQSTLQENLAQIFNQEFKLSATLSESEHPLDDLKEETFPRVIIRYAVSSVAGAFHFWVLPVELTASLVAWSAGSEPQENVSAEDLESFKAFSQQLVEQIMPQLNTGDAPLTVEDLSISLTNSADDLELGSVPEDGIGVVYTVAVGGGSHTVNQYIFQEFAEDNEDADATTLSDEEIDRMLNGDDEGLDMDLGLDSEDDVEVQQVEFGTFDTDTSSNGKGQPRNIDMLLDIDLEILVELGRKNMLIKDVLQLGKGSVVELEKAAGEPLEIFANGRKLAEGEVVVIDDHFGVRITQLVGPAERIKSLG